MRRHPPARKSYRHEVWRLDPPIRMLQLWASLAFGGQATTCDRCLTRDKRSELTLDPGPYNLCNRRDAMKHMQTGLLLGSAPFRRQNSRQAISDLAMVDHAKIRFLQPRSGFSESKPLPFVSPRTSPLGRHPCVTLQTRLLASSQKHCNLLGPQNTPRRERGGILF